MKRQDGFTLMEILLVVAIIAILGGITLPLLNSAMQRAESAGAGQALASAIRDARMRAAASGFQYRVVAYDSKTGALPNAYRIEGAVVPPVGPVVFPASGNVNTPAFYGSSQAYERYTDVSKKGGDFGLAQILVPGGGSFIVTFNSSGQWATNCAPLSCQVQVQAAGGLTTITVSRAGAVQVVKQ